MSRVQAKAPILILTGPPGVGKTTTAEILAARWPRSVHMESDVFFRFIRTDYVEPWKPESHEQNRVVMDVVADAAAGYAAAGYRTIVDGIVIPGWFLEPVRDRLHRDGHSVAYAVLRASRAACTARVQSREGLPPVDSRAIARLWDSFADSSAMSSTSTAGSRRTRRCRSRGPWLKAGCWSDPLSLPVPAIRVEPPRGARFGPPWST
jgi:predicted kinase